VACESWTCPACTTTLNAPTVLALGLAIDAHLNRCPGAEDLIAQE